MSSHTVRWHFSLAAAAVRLIEYSGGETRAEHEGDSRTDEGCSRKRARCVDNAAVLLTGERWSLHRAFHQHGKTTLLKRQNVTRLARQPLRFHPEPVKRPGNKSRRHMKTDSRASERESDI